MKMPLHMMTLNDDDSKRSESDSEASSSGSNSSISEPGKNQFFNLDLKFF